MGEEACREEISLLRRRTREAAGINALLGLPQTETEATILLTQTSPVPAGAAVVAARPSFTG